MAHVAPAREQVLWLWPDWVTTENRQLEDGSAKRQSMKKMWLSLHILSYRFWINFDIFGINAILGTKSVVYQMTEQTNNAHRVLPRISVRNQSLRNQTKGSQHLFVAR